MSNTDVSYMSVRHTYNASDDLVMLLKAFHRGSGNLNMSTLGCIHLRRLYFATIILRVAQVFLS